MRFNRAVLGGLLAAFSITAASAQTGGLKVRVYDAKDNSPLPGATVVLSHATGNVAPATELTDTDGYAVFPILRAGGGYVLDVSFPGYQRVRLTDQRVKISSTVIVPIGMLEAMQEKVEVVGTREAVDLARNDTSTKFSDEFIKDLPVQGRFYQNVLTLAPGVTDPDGTGNPNVRGARARDFKTIVGGVSNVDPFTGTFLSYVNPDSIEEIEVITAGAGVEYGRAQGGFANIVQKQGTNDFEGTFGMLYSSSKLDGAGADKTVPARFFPKFESYQPNVSISGPILKDKLWYVLNYEYHNIQVPVNTLGEIVVTQRVQPIGSSTFTWQASPRNKLAFKWDFDPITDTNLFASSTRHQENLVRREVGGPTYAMQWTAPYSPKLLVDSTVAYQNIHSNQLPMTDAAGPDGILGTADDNKVNYNQCVKGFDLVAGSDCTNLLNDVRTGSYFRTHRDERQRLTVSANAEIFGGKFLGMSHQFKLGFIVENERYFQFENLQPQSTFEIVRDPNRAGNDPLSQTGRLTTKFFVPSVSTARTSGNTWGLFAKDEIKPVNNVSITLGVRLEREYFSSRGHLPFDPVAESADYTHRTDPPSLGGQSLDPVTTKQDVFTAYEDIPNFLSQLATTLHVTDSVLNLNGVTSQSQFWTHRRRPGDIGVTNNNISPQLSVSWDPWSDSKSKFALTLGRHFNNIPLIIPAQEIGAASAFVTFDAPPGGECPAPPAPCPRFQIPLDETTGRPLKLGGRGGLNPAVDVYSVDRGIKTPYQDELSFSFERELTAETLFRFTYVRRDAKDQIQRIDINHAPGDYGSCRIEDGYSVVHQGPRTPQNPTGGDGILDDCTGGFTTTGARDDQNRLIQFSRPDGYPDTYVLNPAWGAVFILGNFNTWKYDGVTLELERRLYRGWELKGSYTWSKAVGSAEDYFEEGVGEDQTTVQQEYGLLSYDQTHVLKVQATTITPWGFRLGGDFSFQSGYPYSLVDVKNSLDAVPPQYLGFGVPDEPRRRRLYPTGQRNDQRNEPFWLFNVKVSKEMNLKGGKNLQVSASIYNLLNQDHLRILRQVNGESDAIRLFGRNYELGMKFAF